MCVLLREKVTSGNSKISQISEWDRYFNYKKQGNKFIIKQIYDTPLVKEDKRANGNHTGKYIYKKYIELLLLNLLTNAKKRTNNCELIMTRKSLMFKLGMMNNNYFSDKKKMGLLKDKTKKYTMYDLRTFEFRANQILNRILQDALDRLVKSDIITCKEVFYITRILNNKQVTYLASASEEEQLRSIKYEARKELGLTDGNKNKYFDNPSLIYLCNKSNDYYEIISDKMYDKCNWDKVTKKIRITYKKSQVIESIDRAMVLLNRLELNSKIVDALNKNANTQYNNMMDKFNEAYSKLLDSILETSGNHNLTKDYLEVMIVPSYENVKVYKPKDTYVKSQQGLAEDLIRIEKLSV